MMPVSLLTHSGPLQKARSVNATDTSFPAKIPTNTEPTLDAGTATGQATIDLLQRGQLGAAVRNAAFLMPFGTGDDDDVFAMRLYGWRRIPGNGTTTRDLWVPVLLCELTCTMSTQVGVAGTPVVATERFCDTLALVTGNDDVSIDIVSPTGNVPAHAVVDVKGSAKLEFTFDMTTGSPTDANCLYALL